MARFQNFSDFYGVYEGSYDGRRARLELSDVKGDSPWPLCHLTFTELERDMVYGGLYTHKTDPDHIMRDIVLNQQGGGDQVTWSRLYLHTWDTNYLSGISVWSGIELVSCSRESLEIVAEGLLAIRREICPSQLKI